MTIEPPEPSPPRAPLEDDPGLTGGAWPSASSWILIVLVLVLVFGVFIKVG